MLRIPTAWMNLAIYDATVLAWKRKNQVQKKTYHRMQTLH
jgi:hypothetical protein